MVGLIIFNGIVLPIISPPLFNIILITAKPIDSFLGFLIFPVRSAIDSH